MKRKRAESRLVFTPKSEGHFAWGAAKTLVLSWQRHYNEMAAVTGGDLHIEHECTLGCLPIELIQLKVIPYVDSGTWIALTYLSGPTKLEHGGWDLHNPLFNGTEKDIEPFLTKMLESDNYPLKTNIVWARSVTMLRPIIDRITRKPGRDFLLCYYTGKDSPAGGLRDISMRNLSEMMEKWTWVKTGQHIIQIMLFDWSFESLVEWHSLFKASYRQFTALQPLLQDDKLLSNVFASSCE